jgi:dCMP deaminase
MTRPSWDSIWMDMAKTIAQRSHHPTFQVGAIVVTEDNTQVLSIGYNGSYKGGPNKPLSEEPGCSGLIHAEINALLKLDYNNPKKKKMYVTLSPCPDCARAIVNSNIESVFYADEYRNVEGLEILRAAGLDVQAVKKKANMDCMIFDRPDLW